MSHSDNKNEHPLNKLADEVHETPQFGMSLFKRVIPLLVVLLLALFLWLFFNKGCTGGNCTKSSCADSTQQNSVVVDTPAALVLDSAALAAKASWEASLGKTMELKLPNGSVISIPSNGFEKKLIDFLNAGCQGDLKKTWFNCDRLLFHTGSSELNVVSLEQIRTLATIFNAYPNAKFKVGGYTDNVGNADANKKLSSERASSVLSAIVNGGVASERMTSEGYGQEHPECPANDTEECKAKNRRVAIRVEQCQ